jgi:hypothetical protein
MEDSERARILLEQDDLLTYIHDLYIDKGICVEEFLYEYLEKIAKEDIQEWEVEEEWGRWDENNANVCLFLEDGHSRREIKYGTWLQAIEDNADRFLSDLAKQQLVNVGGDRDLLPDLKAYLKSFL